MRILIAILALVWASTAGQVAMAHPGHAVETDSTHGLSHYLTHPDHLAQWLIVGIVLALSVLLVRSIQRPAPAYARKD